MNLSKIVTVVLIIVFFGYLMFFAPKVERPTQSTSATISGVVTNHIGDTIKFYAPDSTYITVLDTVTGNFSVEFDWDTTASVSFFHGMESTKMYLQPGDDIQLTIDTEQFDESISYEGSDESSYYAWQYITEEKSVFPSGSESTDDVLDSLFDEYYKPFLVEVESGA